MTETRTRRAAVLSSGGESPGMHGLLRALVRGRRSLASGRFTLDNVKDELDTLRGPGGLRRAGRPMALPDHAPVGGLLGRGGIPTTVDDNLPATDPAPGGAAADSHRRDMVLEVMGRHGGEPARKDVSEW